MKKVLSLLIAIGLLSSCQQIELDDFVPQNQPQTQTQIDEEIINTEPINDTIPLVDFIPALQPFVNEGCQTAWDNLSAIVNQDGSVTYFMNLPDYTADSTDLDKDRFTFFFQAQNPWYGGPWDDGTETPYVCIASAGWLTLPVDDYGNMTCQGLQEIRIWVLDELTGAWYMNSQVCYAAFLCNGQTDCNQGWSFDQIEYVSNTGGFIHLVDGPINGY